MSVDLRPLFLLFPLFFLNSCAETRVPVDISFVAVFEGSPISCTDTPTGLSDLRFFVSDIELIDKRGEKHEVALLQDDVWQSRELALVDLENGQGGCSNGTTEMNTVVSGIAKDLEYAMLRFTVGVPFELNHANPLRALPPLNDPAMHWHWRSGYKFLRAGIARESDGFWAHIGSTGCEGTVQNISACRSPNRISVEIANFSIGSQRIAIDLEALLLGTSLDDNQASDCSSGPAEFACTAVFDALGLDFRGDAKARVQRVFRPLL